ncbi:centrosomal protein of 68 kDa [Ctenodactylus gundi]
MALGEEKAELEAFVDIKAQSGGRLSCKEQEGVPPGPELEQPTPLEARGGCTSPMVGGEGLTAACWAEVTLSDTSGVCPTQPSIASRAPVADGSGPAFSGLLSSANVVTGELFCFTGSQVEDTELSGLRGLPQAVTTTRSTAGCSEHDADNEDDPSPADSPRPLGLSPQPPVPLSTQWAPVMSPRAAVSRLSSSSNSATSMGSSLPGHQETVEPQSDSLAKVSSSLELVVPQESPTVRGPGPRLHRSSEPMASPGDAGLGRRRLSFQAEYWACVLPDSLPPSPDRHSPLWNPNKEYEDLLDYTYPLRPGPQLPKQLDTHMVVDPVLQDSGVDLDSFSVSPASTLQSPTNVSSNCLPAETLTLPFSECQEPGCKRWPSGVPQKQDGMGPASWSPLLSTPRTPGSRNAPWASRETALRGVKGRLPLSRHLEMASPQLRTRNGGQPSPRPEIKRATQNVVHPVSMESGWKSEEDVESDEEYLALPARLTQVSSLVSYLGTIPTLVTLPTQAAERQTSLEVSDSDGPATLPSDSSQSQHSGVAFQRSGAPEGQNHCFLYNCVCATSSPGEGSLVNNQALRVSSGLLKSHPSVPAVLDKWPYSDSGAERHSPRKAGEQERDSLVQCVQTFCCQLEELIRWLYNVTDVTDLGTPPRSSLTGLKSSLQLYRQFKRDIDEHQSLTESVLQKGEILLQCLLDNTPVLKDVLRRIANQSGELESHADRLYDSILASVDTLVGCSLVPDGNKPVAGTEHPCAGV